MKHYHIELTITLDGEGDGDSADGLQKEIAVGVAATLKEMGIKGKVMFEGVVTDTGPFTGVEVN